jgi:hypothetical protein
MPLSFSNMGSTAIIVMVVCLSVAELIKYFKKEAHHLEK